MFESVLDDHRTRDNVGAALLSVGMTAVLIALGSLLTEVSWASEVTDVCRTPVAQSTVEAPL